MAVDHGRSNGMGWGTVGKSGCGAACAGAVYGCFSRDLFLGEKRHVSAHGGGGSPDREKLSSGGRSACP
jgi:hypothetical protein